VHPGEFPKLAGNLEGVNTGLLPPRFLVTGAMKRTMMRAAKRDGEFIACLAAKRARLDKSDVMGLRGFAATQDAGLVGHEPQVLLVAVAFRRADGEDALVDPAGLMSIRAAARPQAFGGRNWIEGGRRIGCPGRNSWSNRIGQTPLRRLGRIC
jgi:hypothetical protein